MCDFPENRILTFHHSNSATKWPQLKYLFHTFARTILSLHDVKISFRVSRRSKMLQPKKVTNCLMSINSIRFVLIIDEIIFEINLEIRFKRNTNNCDY